MNKMQQNKKDHHLLIQYFQTLEKTVPESEIKKQWENQMKKQERRRQLRLKFYSAVASVAALLAGVIWLSYYNSHNTIDPQWSSAISELELHSTDTTEQVLLVTQAKEKIQIDKGSVISYTTHGEVSIDQKKIEKQTEQKKQPTQESIEYNQLIVPKGKYSRLVLADGSSLYVNAGTKVLYPNRFTEKKREIYVDGEIFIDVKHDETRPFIVKTSTFDIQVLGTAFNVNAYKEMEEAEVVLLRGSVEVTDQNQNTTKMSPNELVDLSSGVVIEKRTVNAEDYMAWTKGQLPLAGKNLKIILQKLSFYYGMSIDYDRTLETYPLYGIIDLSVSIEKVLERITKILPVEYERDNNGFYLKENKKSNYKMELPMIE